MADVKEAAWWRRTAWLAAVVIFVWAFFGVLLQIFDVSLDGDIDAVGFPLGYFLAVIAAPVVLAIILFSFVERQKAIDRRYGNGEG